MNMDTGAESSRCMHIKLAGGWEEEAAGRSWKRRHQLQTNSTTCMQRVVAAYYACHGLVDLRNRLWIRETRTEKVHVGCMWEDRGEKASD